MLLQFLLFVINFFYTYIFLPLNTILNLLLLYETIHCNYLHFLQYLVRHKKNYEKKNAKLQF